MSDRIVCDLQVEPETILAAYRGEIRYVQAMSSDGRQIRIGFQRLRAWVGRDGLKGRFEFCIDDRGHLLSAQRLSD